MVASRYEFLFQLCPFPVGSWLFILLFHTDYVILGKTESLFFEKNEKVKLGDNERSIKAIHTLVSKLIS